jgi:serine/threonine-protein kinase
MVGGVVVPVGYLLYQARRLRLLGFAHDDLAPAFQAEIEYAREELPLGHRLNATTGERVLGVVAVASGAVAVLSFLGLLTLLLKPDAESFRLINTLLGTLFVSFSTGMLTTIGYLSRAQRRTDIESTFWGKIWSGKIGRGLFKVAGRLLRGRTLGTAMTHRATELSLGMAAEQLFESLPKETRGALKELPKVLHRLQTDAQALRARYDQFQEALADAGDAASTSAADDLRAARDQVHAKLGETVAALETIRLDLLRLHAGGTTVAGVTTHLDLAADVSAEVERIIAAQGEVEKLLTSVTKP